MTRPASVPKVMPVPEKPVATYTWVESGALPMNGSPSAGSITWPDQRYAMSAPGKRSAVQRSSASRRAWVSSSWPTLWSSPPTTRNLPTLVSWVRR